jgi:uncharacterized protein YdaU (DUF1376 family)
MALPYLNLYIGDIKKDTDLLSPAAFGGYMRLLFKMHESPIRGVVSYTLTQFCRVFGASTIDETISILKEIVDPTYNIVTYLEEGEKYCIVNRRMKRETVISEARREAGKKGAAKTNSKFHQTESSAVDFAAANIPTNGSSNDESKNQQNYNTNTGINNSIGNDNDLKGGVGENANFNNSAHPAGKFIVHEMGRLWLKHNEGYVVDPGEEFHELRAIAEKIAQAAKVDMFDGEGMEIILKAFETLINFAKGHSLYRNYQISQFRKYFNSIATACKNAIQEKQQETTQGKKSIIENAVDAAATAREILQRKREAEQA